MKYLFLLLISFNTQANERPDLEFRPELVQETKAWAQNAQIEIERGTDRISRMPTEEQGERLKRLLNNVLAGSEKENESLMRFILYRAQVVHDILMREPKNPKRDATSRKFLREALQMALGKYQVDMSLFQRMQQSEDPMRPIELAVMGLEWMKFVFSYHYSFSSNQSRYEVLEQSLIIWLNDTAKDAEFNRQLAPVSNEIARFVSDLPNEVPQRNLAVLGLTREMRTFIESEIELAERILSEHSHKVQSNIDFTLRIQGANKR